MAKKKSGSSPKHGFTSRGASRGRRDTHSTPSKTRGETHKQITPNRRNGFADGNRPYDYSAYENEPATPEYMTRLFNQYNFPITEEQLHRFWLYYDLLRQHNARLDLTRIMGIEATVLKHFIDSAIILRWLNPVGPVLDIGSGPGFPGVPLAIMRPDVQFILAESRGKRVGFLEEVAATLKLKNVSIFSKSVREDSPLGTDHGRPIGDIVTRALETMPPTLERVLPFMEPGRVVAFLKGPSCDDEIAEAQTSFTGAYELSGDFTYTLPGTDQGRRLVIFKRCAMQ